MKIKRTLLAIALCFMLVFSLAACGSGSSDSSASADAVSADVKNPDDVSSLKIDNSKWKYDESNDVYYQIGVAYCTDPTDENYETLAIYVPGAYMTAKDNGDGTYTCTLNDDGKVEGYTAETAPVVFPVNTAGYSAQASQTEYSYNEVSSYLKAGYIYVYAGCRGRENGGSPCGVTDLKAAIRYMRYNDGELAGDSDKVFTFGHSGGGAQSAIVGASGDSELYYEYLEEIGAVMETDDGEYISDATYGTMAWCPITNLDTADAAYEWMMGQYSDSGTRSGDTWTGALSDDLAEAYAEYINELGLKDKDGKTLTLDESEDGIYASGTYYEYLKETIEDSLNNFLKDTEFPYTAGSGNMDGMPGGSAPSGEAPSGDMPSREAPSGDASGGAPSGDAPGSKASGGMPGGNSGGSDSSSGTTYESAQDYIDALNEDGEWIKYDAETNTATITSVEDFVKHCKTATKDVGAFDALNRSQAENKVFGTDDGEGLHFDQTIADLLEKNSEEYSKYSDYDSSYADEYAEDIEKEDELGNSSQTRQNMYNPMYYLSDHYDGAGSSTVSKYWRINSGIEQGDTSLTTEMNLALALKSAEGVEDVDFTTVWGQGHTTAERSGDSTTNFIDWVNECCGK